MNWYRMLKGDIEAEREYKYSSQGSGGATWKDNCDDQKRSDKTGRDGYFVRTVQCEYCGKTHNVMSGEWVYNGNQIPLCHSGVSDDCCFTKYRKDREMESGEGSR